MGRPGGLLLLPLLLATAGGAGAGSCEPQASCEACVRSHPRCAWCEDPDFTRGGQAEATRCGPRAALERAGCPPGAVVEPRGSVRVLRDEGPGAGGGQGAPTQLRPQSVQLLLRPGEERSFQVRFRRAPAQPLDLYYLMDLSFSMRDDLESVRRLGSELLATLRNVTPSVRIGFGSFVDKPVLPYVSTAPSRLRDPCPVRAAERCDPPAAFRHLLPLSADGAAFARRVGRLRVSGNLDAPESGLDALLQAAVCQERIGWRRGTRLLLFASDDTFHSAGDGKLGGLVLPSDTHCHLDAAGVYARSHLHDYPSVGLLAQVLAAANIQPIFAVTAPTLPVYQELSRLIPKSVVGELREDSSNVVQLIADAYHSLSSTVELQHSPLPPGISLSYESHCGDPPGPPRPQGGLCRGVGVNQEVTFTVRVQAHGCLPSPRRVGLRVLGGPEELALQVGTLCDCPCAQRPTRDPHCHGGTLSCGVCSCPPGRRGRRCECVEGGPGGGCRAPNGTDPPCGGCLRHQGLPCGGPERGECVCGTCRCRGGFEGPSCACPAGPGACLRGGRECGGRGRCVCGTCRCAPPFAGARCERCPGCGSRCQRLRDCAACGALGQGPLRGNCSHACGHGGPPRALPAPPPDPRGWCRERSPDGRLLLFLIEGAAEEEEEEEGGGARVTLVWAEEAGGGPWPWLAAAAAAAAGAALAGAGLAALALSRLLLRLRARRRGQQSATTATGNPGYRPSDPPTRDTPHE